jgi:UDPglucose 6-dehydrogenase|tara:strand:- start:100 stop:432 length:333 start_codon:yes stop_codon:yes gene_type:complete
MYKVDSIGVIGLSFVGTAAKTGFEKKVVEYALYDKRLGNTHFSVPGPDGKLGFGGSCFPKDLNAFINLAERLGIDSMVLSSVWKKNLELRPEKDWEKLLGRAVNFAKKEN